MTALNRGERWTDYAFLKISRDSEEPRRHEDNHNAIRISLHRTSPTVLASGATVAAALSTLPLGEADGARRPRSR